MLCSMVIYKTVNLFLLYGKWCVVCSVHLNKALNWCDIHVCNYSIQLYAIFIKNKFEVIKINFVVHFSFHNFIHLVKFY